MKPSEFYGVHERKFDDKKRVVIPSQFQEKLKEQIFVWTPEKKALPPEMRESHSNILCLLAQTGEVFEKELYKGKRKIEDVFMKLHEVPVRESNRIGLPAEVRAKIEKGEDVLFVGCRQYVALVKKAVEESIEEK
jgi:DNA-binding transcriptional regulator/RsmH inhibitor MraZ